jgi:hypothetical protein
MLTCCVEDMQSSQHRHQQPEQQDQLRREMRGVWAKARKACLCLLLETAGRPYLGNVAAADAAKLSIDYSRISSSGWSSEEWSELLLKELEAAAYPYQVIEMPHKCQMFRVLHGMYSWAGLQKHPGSAQNLVRGRGCLDNFASASRPPSCRLSCHGGSCRMLNFTPPKFPKPLVCPGLFVQDIT